MNSNKPLVSCIVVNKNYGRFLADAINSMLAQNYPKDCLEILVVDYGSTDSSKEIIESFGSSIRKLYIDSTFLGAINTAIKKAQGKYISFIGADDMWLPDKIVKQVDILEANPNIGLVYSDMIVISEDKRVLAPSFWKLYSIKPLKGKVIYDLALGNFVSGGTIMVRSDLTDLYYPIPENVGFDRSEDWWIALNIAGHYDLEYIDEPLTLYRVHGQNMAIGMDVKKTSLDSKIDVLSSEVLAIHKILEILRRDAECPQELLNRMQNRLAQKETELRLAQSAKRSFTEFLMQSIHDLFSNPLSIKASLRVWGLTLFPHTFNTLRTIKNKKLSQ